jgi:chemotaxis signal transduction protein
VSAQWLVATVAGTAVAVCLRDVQEIIDAVGVTLLPRLPAAMPGVLDWRNRAIPLIDLGALCGERPRHDRRNAVIATAGSHILALLIDSIDGIHDGEEIGEDVRRIDPLAVLDALA